MDHPGRLALLARALPAIGLSRSAHSRWPLEVGQAGRAGIFGIIWRVLSAYRYLERSREPGRQLARPMEFSRTRTTSRPTRALETSEKCARFKENEGHANVDPRQGKGDIPPRFLGTRDARFYHVGTSLWYSSPGVSFTRTCTRWSRRRRGGGGLR